MRRLLPLSLLALAMACNKDKGVVLPEEEGPAPYVPPDNDADGYAADVDCDDDNAAIHPDAVELCDGINNDCDTVIDEPGGDGIPFYRDADGDGYGDAATTISSCEQPPGYISDATDCDDTSAAASPGATEICNDGLDNNCNGDETECALSGSFTYTNANAIFTGPSTGERVAGPIVGGADLTGDGIGDLLIGSARSDTSGVDSGVVYVQPGPLVAGRASLSAAPFRLYGSAAGHNAGASLWMGDLNGDGHGDAVIGAPKGKGGGTDSGEAYLVLGPVTADVSLYASNLRLIGEITYDLAGTSVSGAGDLTGDGVADLVVSAIGQGDGSFQQQGAAYVVSGALVDSVDLSLAEARILGDEDYDRLGTQVIGDADTDGDGVSELFASGYTWPSNDNQGAVWMFEAPISGGLAAADAAARLEGEERDDQSGTAFAVADLNDDGKDDIVISAPYAGDDLDEQGIVYVIDGPVSGTISLSTASSRLLGPKARDRIGADVDAGGDVDGNGVSDLLIGASAADTDTTDSGGAWLLYSPLPAGTMALDASGIALVGAARDELGAGVGFIGEMNGDITEDFAVGAASNDLAGTDAGGVFVIFGQGL